MAQQQKYAVIGTLEVPKPTIVRKDGGYAAWYWEIELHPGVYELRAEIENGKVKDFPGVWSIIDGTVVDEHFGAYFGGVMIAESPKRDVGNKMTYHFRLYAHQAANFLLGRHHYRDPWWKMQLNPGFEARVVHFVYQGEPSETTKIVVVEPAAVGTL